MTFAAATAGVMRLTSWLRLVQLADECWSNNQVESERLGLAFRRR